MRVTEKCDVHSFGILTLEVLMGKHPGELISSLHFPEAAVQGVHYKDVLDPRLSPPASQNIIAQLDLIMNLAISCVNINPQYRPTMQNMSKTLEVQAADH